MHAIKYIIINTLLIILFTGCFHSKVFAEEKDTSAIEKYIHFSQNGSDYLPLITDTTTVKIPASIHRAAIHEAILLKRQHDKRTILLNKAKYKNRLMLINMFLVICISALIVLLVRNKYKKEKLLEAYATETRIAQKVHDEIANEIFNAITFTSSLKYLEGDNKEKLMKSLDQIYTVTRNISRENGNIDVSGSFSEQLKCMLTEFSSRKVHVIAKGIEGINWQKVETTAKIAVYRALQELLINMKKHSKASLTVIEFTLNNKRITIKYSDNGVGISKKKPLRKNGLLNVESRIEAINGVVHFEDPSEKGFRLTLTFPVNNYV